MPRMRHPKIPGSEINPAESAVSFHSVAGWLPEEEWEAAGLADPEPEPEPDKSGEDAEQDSKPSRRAKPRATSEKESD